MPVPIPRCFARVPGAELGIAVICLVGDSDEKRSNG